MTQNTCVKKVMVFFNFSMLHFLLFQNIFKGESINLGTGIKGVKKAIEN